MSPIYTTSICINGFVVYYVYIVMVFRVVFPSTIVSDFYYLTWSTTRIVSITISVYFGNKEFKSCILTIYFLRPISGQLSLGSLTICFRVSGTWTHISWFLSSKPDLDRRPLHRAIRKLRTSKNIFLIAFEFC